MLVIYSLLRIVIEEMSFDFAIVIYFLVGFFDNELSESISSSQGEPNVGGKVSRICPFHPQEQDAF